MAFSFSSNVQWPSFRSARLGPFEFSNGNLYAVARRDSTAGCHILRSTDGGANWTEHATASAPHVGECGDVVQDGDAVYILDANNTALIYRWRESDGFTRMDSGTGPSIFPSVAGQRAAFLAVRSSTEFVVFYNGPTQSVMGTARRRVFYSRYVSGAWQTAVSVDGLTGVGADGDARAAILGASGRVHFFYTRSNSTSSLHSKTLSAANGLSAESTPATGTGMQTAVFPLGLPVNANGNILVPFYDGAAASFRLVTGTSADAPSWGTATIEAVVVQTDSSNPGVLIWTGVTVGNDQIHAVYTDNATADLFHEQRTTSATWTGTKTEVEDAVTVQGVSAGWLPSLGAVGYLFNDNGTVKFGRFPAAAGALTLSIGKRASAPTLRGTTLAGAGSAALSIARRAGAAVLRGVTAVGAGAVALSVGHRPSATTLRGADVAPAGAATLSVGHRPSGATLRGADVEAAGAAALSVGHRPSGAVGYGVDLALDVSIVELSIGHRPSGAAGRGVDLLPQTSTLSVGHRPSGAAGRGVDLFSGAAQLSVGHRPSGAAGRGVTLTPQTSALSIGHRPSGATLRGVSVSAEGAVALSVGHRVGAPTLRGVTASAGGTVALSVGRRPSQALPRGNDLLATGQAALPVGFRASGAEGRGVNVALFVYEVLSIGRRLRQGVQCGEAACGTVACAQPHERGVTVVGQGAAPVSVGHRPSAPDLRGVTLAGSGVSALSLAHRTSSTALRGVTLTLDLRILRPGPDDAVTLDPAGRDTLTPVPASRDTLPLTPAGRDTVVATAAERDTLTLVPAERDDR